MFVAVFADIPNLIPSFNPSKLRSEGIPFSRPILWDQLYAYIQKFHIKEDEFLHAKAYGLLPRVKLGRLADCIALEMHTIAKAGFQVISADDRDIDSLVVGDLWDTAAHIQQLRVERNEKIAHARFVVLSGDRMFIKQMKAIRARYQATLQLQTVLYTWRAALSENAPKVNDIRYLDDLTRNM